jgi:hypothetical protein
LCLESELAAPDAIARFCGKFVGTDMVKIRFRSSAIALRGALCSGWSMLALSLLLVPVVASGRDVFGSPQDYLELLRQLGPGDRLLLRAGQYASGLPLHNLNGAPGAPIVVAGPVEPPGAVFQALDRANTVSILNASYVEVRNLELAGRGLKTDAVKAEGSPRPSHHILLQNLLIHGYGSDQSVIGISTKCPAWDWVIRRNTIIGAGTGLYLGNSDGRAPFVAGLIEHNLLIDSVGYNLQIKHQTARPRLAGEPDSARATVIRHNVFSKSSAATSSRMARPSVLVGDILGAEASSDVGYLVYGNVFLENPSEALFQGEGNVALYDNLFVNTRGDAVVIQPHHGIPRRISIFHNTVLASGNGIALHGGRSEYVQAIFANAIFANEGVVGGVQTDNVVQPLASASAYLTDPSREPGRLDVAPRPGRLWGSGRRGRPELIFPDANADFEGASRQGERIGAYFTDGPARWRPKLEIKPLPRSP